MAILPTFTKRYSLDHVLVAHSGLQRSNTIRHQRSVFRVFNLIMFSTTALITRNILLVQNTMEILNNVLCINFVLTVKDNIHYPPWTTFITNLCKILWKEVALNLSLSVLLRADENHVDPLATTESDSPSCSHVDHKKTSTPIWRCQKTMLKWPTILKITDTWWVCWCISNY